MKFKSIILISTIIISMSVMSSCGKTKTVPMVSGLTASAMPQPTPNLVMTPNALPTSTHPAPVETKKPDFSDLKSSFQMEIDKANNIIGDIESMNTTDLDTKISDFSEIKHSMNDILGKMKLSYDTLDDNGRALVGSAENIVGRIDNIEKEFGNIGKTNLDELLKSFQKMGTEFKDEISKWNNLSKI